MLDIRERPTVPASWASAGIVDARVFSVGESDTVHELTHASPNLVRGKCGITAHVVERSGRLATWRNAHVNCRACLVEQPRRRRMFLYRGCQVTPETSPEPILIGCNRDVNRYLTEYWRVTFPDGTWVKVGTKLQARRSIERNLYAHS